MVERAPEREREREREGREIGSEGEPPARAGA